MTPQLSWCAPTRSGPLSTIKTIQVVTAAGAGGGRRLNGEKTLMLSNPNMVGHLENARQASSQSNLKQISLGIIQHVQDNDQKMPDADKWVDEVMPYIKSEAVFTDPSAPGLKWAYAFNRALSGKKLSDLEGVAHKSLRANTRFAPYKRFP